MPQAFDQPSAPVIAGWCDRCGVEHRLPAAGARRHALDLQRQLAAHRRIDFTAAAADPRFGTGYLFGPARGQMFGVLECADEHGEVVVLRAFSGQYDGVWTAPGWVPPVFDIGACEAILTPGDLAIKALERRIDAAPDGATALVGERRQLSRSLMKRLHELYRLRNFRGEVRALTDFFVAVNGPPAGAGDCCAPKLLHHAATCGLQPLGLAEFYWGAPNRSGSRKHGTFYGNCPDKCAPILGFLLCGAVP